MTDLHPRQTSDACSKCGKRPGSIVWGDALAQTHGFATKRCEVCVYTEQLVHARERARAIPRLEAKLKAAKEANR